MEMEQKEPAGGQKRMSSVIKKYMFVLRSVGKLVHEREMHVLYVLAEHNGITSFQGPGDGIFLPGQKSCLIHLHLLDCLHKQTRSGPHKIGK